MARETLVLLPGMMCDGRLFVPQLEALAATHDVVVGELVGSDSIDGLANQVLADVQAETFNLAGLSMGGIVAMAMAALAPSRVKRLALLDTNHRADAQERRGIRDLQIDNIRAGHLRAVIIDEMKPNYLAVEHRDNQALLDLLVDMAMDLGAEVFISQSLALRDRPDQSAALADYDGPALVLCGEEDTLCPVDRHHEMTAILPDADLVIVPHAGHITTLENPDAVNTAMADWLARPGRAPAAVN